MRRVVVIGAGASGLMAALFALREGAHVTLVERNEKAGKKLYITGKGRCNLTNVASPEAFFFAIHRNPRFFYSAYRFLSNEVTIDLFEALGLKLKVERGGRVFPNSDHASDVTRTLTNAIRASGGVFLFNERVSRLLTGNSGIEGVETTSGRRIQADAVIVATGGLSYPSTGSDGDGYQLARAAGHTVQEPRPSLTALETEESWPGALAGLSLKNVRLTWQQRNKTPFREMGEMLFTHTGVSGPLVLTLSALLPDKPQGSSLFIDLKPALERTQLDARLLRDFSAMKNRRLLTVVEGLVPRSLAAVLLQLCHLPTELPVHSVTAAQRHQLLDILKSLPITVRAYRGFQEAIVTRGGVNVREVSPGTMESKLLRGLYFAGEVLDIDAETGGYNLQIAFSTGALAGKSAADPAAERK